MLREPAISPAARQAGVPFPCRAGDLTLTAMNEVVHTLHPKVDVAHFEIRETFLFGSGQVSRRDRDSITRGRSLAAIR